MPWIDTLFEDTPVATLHKVAGMAEVKNPAHKIWGNLNKNNAKVDRWLAASTMQKAIRRGHYETAVRAAFQLYMQPGNSAYVWGRLSVIALEDIGVVQMNVVGVVLFVAKNYNARVHIGEPLALATLVFLMCCSAKNRALCDAMVWAEYHFMLEHARKNAKEVSGDTLYARVLEVDNTFIGRVIAALCFSGKSFDKHAMPTKFWDLSEALIQRGCKASGWPEGASHLINLNREAQRVGECMGVLIPLLFDDMAASTITKGGATTEPPMFIKGYPEYAYDTHTGTGRTAFGMYVKNSSLMRGLLKEGGITPGGNRIDFIGELVFRVEGEVLDRWRTWENSSASVMGAAEACIMSEKVSKTLMREAIMLIEEEQDLIRWARVKSAETFS